MTNPYSPSTIDEVNECVRTLKPGVLIAVVSVFLAIGVVLTFLTIRTIAMGLSTGQLNENANGPTVVFVEPWIATALGIAFAFVVGTLGAYLTCVVLRRVPKCVNYTANDAYSNTDG
ncbi:hypothetical protein Mal65_02330 [Crateriforma conspicua]|nr:hypothetical protein Mal65_02330 [Crateriforma conspicua]